MLASQGITPAGRAKPSGVFFRFVVVYRSCAVSTILALAWQWIAPKTTGVVARTG